MFFSNVKLADSVSKILSEFHTSNPYTNTMMKIFHLCLFTQNNNRPFPYLMKWFNWYRQNAELPNCRAVELPSCRAAELLSYRDSPQFIISRPHTHNTQYVHEYQRFELNIKLGSPISSNVVASRARRKNLIICSPNIHIRVHIEKWNTYLYCYCKYITILYICLIWCV